jgi:maleylpyruvate isomerase
MDNLSRDRAGATKAHSAVVAALRLLTDDQVGQSSPLPDWTVGHVATHIARNAEGHLRMFEAAAKGMVGVMYPGGREQRTADIESGARRNAAEIAADVADSAARLETAWDAMTETHWAGRGVAMSGDVVMSDLPFVRWREVAVHHADLGIGYSWADWDDDYVRIELHRSTMLWASRKPMGMTVLPPQASAAPPHRRVAWLLGRADIDGLGPAGLVA